MFILLQSCGDIDNWKCLTRKILKTRVVARAFVRKHIAQSLLIRLHYIQQPILRRMKVLWWTVQTPLKGVTETCMYIAPPSLSYVFLQVCRRKRALWAEVRISTFVIVIMFFSGLKICFNATQHVLYRKQSDSGLYPYVYCILCLFHKCSQNSKWTNLTNESISIKHLYDLALQCKVFEETENMVLHNNALK